MLLISMAFAPDGILGGGRQSHGGGFFHADMLGNPDNPGLYMFLSKEHDGATLPPHWHSGDENVTILSGTPDSSLA
jgi:anti-sigma factor ChrR (cupin superfamily)